VSDWSTRPLSPKQIDYLVDDVAHLLEMQDKLTAKLEAAGRYEWALDECRQLATLDRYRVDERRLVQRVPGSNRLSRRELGVLAQIVLLRDRLARERDVPPKYIFPDDVLAGLATLQPRTPEDLSQLRRLDAGMRRSFGDSILEAVKRGEALPEDQLPERPARPLGNARETLVALLGVALGEIARENDLPASLLVPRSSLERVAREIPADREAFERTLGATGWRLGLVGDELWRLLSGDASISVKGYTHGDPKIIFSHDKARE
jgi:ribonuclease D